MPGITPLCFWPGGFQPPIPDAKHPGKAWENPRGKVNFPKPQRNARNKYRFTYQYLRQEWVQGGHRPGAEFEAAQASTFTCWFLYCSQSACMSALNSL